MNDLLLPLELSVVPWALSGIPLRSKRKISRGSNFPVQARVNSLYLIIQEWFAFFLSSGWCVSSKLSMTPPITKRQNLQDWFIIPKHKPKDSQKTVKSLYYERNSLEILRYQPKVQGKGKIFCLLSYIICYVLISVSGDSLVSSFKGIP